MKKYRIDELRVVKTMNCLNRVRDLALTQGIEKNDLILLFVLYLYYYCFFAFWTFLHPLL